MKIAIAIETVDRRIRAEVLGHPEVNYLGQTLANLARAGVWASPYLHSVHVVSGGERPDFFATELLFPGPITIHPCPPEGRTRQQNGAMAIRVAAETSATYALKLEDDLDFCDDFLGSTARWLHRYGNEPVDFFALGMAFATYEHARYASPTESILGPGTSFPRVRQLLAEGKQFYRHNVKTEGGFWGAQAIVFRREDARRLVEWLGPDPAYKGRLRARAHDLMVGEWAHHVGVALPSFVQHLGRHSSIAKARYFEFPWPGRAWRYET